MKRSGIISSICLALAVAGLTFAPAAPGADALRTTNTAERTINGRVVRMNSTEVEIEPLGASGLTKTVPVNKIKALYFDDEPTSLREARIKANDGDYEEAAALLEKLTKADEQKGPRIAADIHFYKALCDAKQALAGNGSIAEAGRAMADFVGKNPENFHYLQACEIVGDLLVADGRYPQAEAFYGRLAKAPWEDYKMRAGVGLGRALLAQGKIAEAGKTFDDVLANEALGDQADAQRLTAKLGKARCLAAENKTAVAMKMVKDIIDKADSADTDLLANAYTTLGIALRKTGQTKEAMMAFLHVDVLYNSDPECHAESLFNLIELFNEQKKLDHSAACLQKLRQNYPNSPWTAKAK